MVDGSLQLTLAGWWVAIVFLPLYGFLFGRWLLRFVTWGFMLYDISRCDLRLVATHPDRCGGLAFMGQYPKTYVLFVFAESTVVSATVLKLVVHGDASLMSFKFALFGMIALFAVAFVVPLAVFAPRLVALKRAGPRALRLTGEPAQRGLRDQVDLGTGCGAGRGIARVARPVLDGGLRGGLRPDQAHAPVPVTLESVMPIVLAALVPLVCVAVTQVPFDLIVEEIDKLMPL